MSKPMTFEDLEWRDHPTGGGKQGLLFFPNGFGVSVVRFLLLGTYGSYTSNENEWELAVLEGTPDGWNLTYETPITEDVMGHLSADEVTDIMKRIQELPDAKGLLT